MLGLRPSAGIRDESDTWSLTLEERWNGEEGGDGHPHDLVRRALEEELGIVVRDADIRVLAWGIEATVLYPGFLAIASTSLTSWQVERMQPHAADAGELRTLSSIPAGPASLRHLLAPAYAAEDQPNSSRPWHRTSRARLLHALAHLMKSERGYGRDDLLGQLGRIAADLS
jgi:hypothetical protein